MGASSGKSPRGREVRPVRRASEAWGRSGERTLQRRYGFPRETGCGDSSSRARFPHGRRPMDAAEERASAGGVCSGVWVAAPGEWSVTQSREGLTAARPEAQASVGEAPGGRETDGSGRSSEDARDSRTLAEQRTRGTTAYAGWARTRPDMPCGPTGDSGRVAEGVPRVCQTPWGERAHPGGMCGPAVLKPYWGKPAVRNFRGAR